MYLLVQVIYINPNFFFWFTYTDPRFFCRQMVPKMHVCGLHTRILDVFVDKWFLK